MKETKRQKELRQLHHRIAKLESMRNGAISALVECENKLPLLRKQLERKLKYDRLKLLDRPVSDPGITQDSLPGPAKGIADDGGGADDEPVLHDQPGGEPRAAQDDGGIPDFLRRTSLSGDVAQAAYAVANSHNTPPTPEQKKLVAKEKAKVREERKDAVLTGKTKKWPVSGREASHLLKGGG